MSEDTFKEVDVILTYIVLIIKVKKIITKVKKKK